MLLSIWDDCFGISVANEHQIVKQNISEVLGGFKRDPNSEEGFDLYTVPGWDYPTLVETYQKAVEVVREKHIPAIIHVIELTQHLVAAGTVINSMTGKPVREFRVVPVTVFRPRFLST